MVRTILVPLDGSACGERALPMALTLNQATKARLVLVCVALAPMTDGPGEALAEFRAVEEAEQYLKSVAGRLRGQGIEVETAVPYGAPADSILLEIGLRHADLVVMCTHGRSGLGRWVYGSVAEGVLAHCPVPVLLVRPSGPEAPTIGGAATPLLVALDGSAFSEASLPHAAALARDLGAGLVLLRVVRPSMPSDFSLESIQQNTLVAMEQAEESEVAEAREYLEKLVAHLEEEGIAARSLVRQGWPAQVILDEAADTNAGLIVMATHGYTGLRELIFGSVAHEVVRRASLPLLLVRPAEVLGSVGRAGAVVEA